MGFLPQLGAAMFGIVGLTLGDMSYIIFGLCTVTWAEIVEIRQELKNSPRVEMLFREATEEDRAALEKSDDA